MKNGNGILTMKSRGQLKKLVGIILTVLILLTPIVVTILLLRGIFQSNLTQFHLAWSDEVQYWQEINTFRHIGFQGGYFSVEELTAGATFSHFGPHGFVYPMFMGLLARLGGWNERSGPLYNLFFITIGLVVFLLTAKPTLRSKVFLFGFVVFLYPLLLYIPSTMQESLNQALAFTISGLLILILSRKQFSPALFVLAILFVAFASLIRVTWALVFLPLFYLLGKKRFPKQLPVLLFTGAGIILAMAVLFSYWTSPYPDWYIYKFVNMNPFSIKDAVISLARHGRDNWINFISIPEGANTMEILLRYQILALNLVMIGFVLKKKTQFLVPLFILLSETLATILIYDIAFFRDFRTLSPFMIMGVLFLIHYSDFKPARWCLMVFILANLLFFRPFLDTYQNEFHTDHFSPWQSQPISSLANLTYQVGQPAWCNSILTVHTFSRDLLSLPAGIGVNVILEEDRIAVPVKSHYLLLPPEMAARLVGDQAGMTEIEWIGDIALYEQLGDGCNR